MAKGKAKDLDKAEEKKEEKKEEKPKKLDKKVEAVSLVRLVGTDLNGDKSVLNAIKNVKGVSHAMAKAVCNVSGMDCSVKLNTLDESQLKKFEEIIKDPIKFGIPNFLVNRKIDVETGQTMHLTGSDLTVANKFDIQRYVDLKNYRGWRHVLGQPVRGQKTRSHFRQKGRVVGVMRKAIKLQMGGKSAEAGAAAPAAPAAAKKEEKK